MQKEIEQNPNINLYNELINEIKISNAKLKELTKEKKNQKKKIGLRWK